MRVYAVKHTRRLAVQREIDTLTQQEVRRRQALADSLRAARSRPPIA